MLITLHRNKWRITDRTIDNGGSWLKVALTWCKIYTKSNQPVSAFLSLSVTYSTGSGFVDALVLLSLLIIGVGRGFVLGICSLICVASLRLRVVPHDRERIFEDQEYIYHHILVSAVCAGFNLACTKQHGCGSGSGLSDSKHVRCSHFCIINTRYAAH